ncbi:hypothetical protein A8926_3490 [Saccharopolyspora spinosa]|uniref:Uncharacterized protein n=1 Tax=Saccharopolyspora spinosa TaxID=60894 RepID=A0A2N3XYQ2_SACSN|nr:hypothetical protein A8926_3490 [Saccharopolyspora spinosa]
MVTTKPGRWTEWILVPAISVPRASTGPCRSGSGTAESALRSRHCGVGPAESGLRSRACGPCRGFGELVRSAARNVRLARGGEVDDLPLTEVLYQAVEFLVVVGGQAAARSAATPCRCCANNTANIRTCPRRCAALTIRRRRCSAVRSTWRSCTRCPMTTPAKPFRGSKNPAWPPSPRTMRSARERRYRWRISLLAPSRCAPPPGPPQPASGLRGSSPARLSRWRTPTSG